MKIFSTSGDVQTALDNGTLGKPYVAYIEDGQYIDWNTREETNYNKIPLTFEITSDGTILWKATNNLYPKTIEYSKNGGTWTSIASSTGGASIDVSSGDIVQFRGDNAQYCDNNATAKNCFAGTAKFNAYGNIMSLINSTNFSGLTSLESGFTFYYLFMNCNGLTDASNLILPATALTNNCYFDMFANCKSLTVAPELPATTLVDRCYKEMFYGCTSLNYIKCLATDTSAVNCTEYWVGSVAASGTFVTPSTTSWGTGVNGIPNNWTRVNA